MSLGMGTPLLVVGASAGKLLPRAGAWMDTVKQLFGVLMLAVAAWMLTRIVPERVALVLWAVPALLAALRCCGATRARRTGARLARARGGVAAGLYGVVLARRRRARRHRSARARCRASRATHRRAAVSTIKSLADLEREVASAKRAGRPVMLDFYADWCVSCKEMERYTFSDPRGAGGARASVVLLRADVTRNDDARPGAAQAFRHLRAADDRLLRPRRRGAAQLPRRGLHEGRRVCARSPQQALFGDARPRERPGALAVGVVA